jgi:hypothetical protein
VDLLEAANVEASRAETERIPEADLFRRQAAEKIWGFIVSELNRTLRGAGYPVEPGPGSHEARRKWLKELDRALGTSLVSRHDAYADLHGSCFYEARCPPPDTLHDMLEGARPFVDSVALALREVRRRGPRAA